MPEAEQFVYRVCQDAGRDGVAQTVNPMSLRKAREYALKIGEGTWIERASVNEWEPYE